MWSISISSLFESLLHSNSPFSFDEIMQSPEQLNLHSQSHPQFTSNDTSATNSGNHLQHPRPSGHNQRRTSSPNASSAPITLASGSDTKGIVNQHPTTEVDAHQGKTTNAAAAGAGAGNTSTLENDQLAPLFRVGVSEDRNKKCRRTMEDSHAFVYDFGGVKVRPISLKQICNSLFSRHGLIFNCVLQPCTANGTGSRVLCCFRWTCWKARCRVVRGQFPYCTSSLVIFMKKKRTSLIIHLLVSTRSVEPFSSQATHSRSLERYVSYRRWRTIETRSSRRNS